NRFRLTGRHEMAFEPGTRDAHIGRQTTTAVEPLAPPELLLLPGSDRVDDVARDAETAHDVVVERAHGAGRDGAHRQLLVAGHAQLAHEKHVERRTERAGHLVRHGYPASRQGER